MITRIVSYLALLALAMMQVPAAPQAAGAPVAVTIKRVLLVNETPAVLLVDGPEKRFLLVFVDYFMADAIMMGMRGAPLDRPLTHDLIGIFLRRLGASIDKVTITEVRNNTYYALITLSVNGGLHEIDSRPSDAMAIAVRGKIPLFVSEELLREFGQGDLEEQLRPENRPGMPPGQPSPRRPST